MGVRAVLPGARGGDELRRNPPGDRRDAALRSRLVHRDVDPRDRDHRAGRRRREHPRAVRPGNHLDQHRVRRRPDRNPVVRGLRSRGLDRRGKPRPGTLDPTRTVVDGCRLRGLLRSHVLRHVDRPRQRGGGAGCLARPGRAGQHGEAVHRVEVRRAGRSGRDPGRDGTCARHLRHDRTRLLRARARWPASVGVREDVAASHALGGEPDGGSGRRWPDVGRGVQPHARPICADLRVA